MTNYYVRKTGNDTTGDGSTGNPWLTVNKGLATIPDASGNVLLIGTGTYAEDSGSGYLQTTRTLTNRILVTSETGLNDVIISGTTGAYVLVSSATGWFFDTLTFRGMSASTTACVRMLGTAVANINFNRCVFQNYAGSSGANLCITTAFTSGAGTGVSNIEIANCTFQQLGSGLLTGTLAGIIFDASLLNAGGATNVRIIDNDIRLSGFGVRMYAVTGAQILGNKVHCWGLGVSVHPLEFGVDGPTGSTCSGLISGNSFRSVNGHATVIGAGCNGVLVTDNRFYGGGNSSNGQGLVVKEAQNVRIVGNTVYGGYLSGLYFKAASDCVAIGNRIFNTYANSPALRVGINSEDSKACQRLTVRQNEFWANAGTVLGFGVAADDAGGSVVDENVYILTGTATLGSVRGTSVTTYSGLRGAWSSYDKSNNDGNSKIGLKHSAYAGVPDVLLPA